MITPLDYTVAAMAGLASLMAFVLMGLDKWKARRGGFRIAERALLLWCVCFGALGGWLGMQVFRHKTQHRKFTITVPVLMVCQFALLGLYIRHRVG